MTVPTVTSLLQGFFTERLVRQLQASPQTVSATGTPSNSC